MTRKWTVMRGFKGMILAQSDPFIRSIQVKRTELFFKTSQKHSDLTLTVY